jgi:polyphosphate kinase
MASKETFTQAKHPPSQVTVLVELKARCEEARNINIAEMLEDAGCNVAYGLVGLTTHAKASMVVRKEGSEHNTYVHMGTGDYNARQAAAYTDFSLFRCVWFRRGLP